MIDFIKENEWSVIEEGFDAKRVMACESIFSIGNGKFGQRANFEEDFSGKHLYGTYKGFTLIAVMLLDEVPKLFV